jgi:hypothetical protein
MIGRRQLRRNTKITITTSATASSSSNCTSSHRGADVVVRIGEQRDLDRAGQRACNCGSSCLHAVDDLDHVRARLALHVDDDRRRRCRPGARRVFSAPSTTSATSASRTGAPCCVQRRSAAGTSSAERSWSLASIVDARVGPSKLPFAWLTFAFAIACADRRGRVRRPRAPSDSPGCARRGAGRRAMLTSPRPAAAKASARRGCRRGHARAQRQRCRR